MFFHCGLYYGQLPLTDGISSTKTLAAPLAVTYFTLA